VQFILDQLNTLDTDLYIFLNRKLMLPVVDKFMVAVTNDVFGFSLIALAAIYYGVRKNRRQLKLIAVAVAALIVTDAVSARLMKPFFGRTRPCYQVDNNRVLTGACGSEFGFPSNHAANAMAVATVIGLAQPLMAPIAAGGAFLIGISRVFVGVHYPFDVFAGLILGMFFGFLFYTAANRRWGPL
jgi:undecaprenyl-diphosphatase